MRRKNRFYYLLAIIVFLTLTTASAFGAPLAVKKDSTSTVTDTTKTAATTTKSDTAKTDTTSKSSKRQGLTDTVFYSAEGGYIDYDVEKKKMHLIGNAKIKYQDMTLVADSIMYMIDDNLMIATGKPQLIENKDTTIGESMVYNMKTKRGRVKYASAHMDEAHVNGNKIVKTEDNTLYIDEGDYTTCAYVDSPDYFFYGKNIKVIPEKDIICRPVVFALCEAPVAALPFFMFPLEHNRQSGFLTPSWGGRPETGAFLDNLGYYYVPNEYMDASAWFRVQDFRDFVVNATSRYNLKYVLSGSIAARYAATGDISSRNQNWSLDYNHNQNITPDGNFTLSGRGSMVGTQTFYRSFSEDSAQLLDQNINANLSLHKTFSSINASADLNWNQTHNLSTGQISEDLPSLSFSLPSRPFVPFTPKENLAPGEKDDPNWYNKITYSYSARAVCHNNSAPGTDTGQNFSKTGISQSVTLSSPQTIFKYITVNPNVSAQLSLFDSYMQDTTSDTARFSDTTFDTLTKAQRAGVVPDTFYYVDTMLTQNNLTGINDTTFKRARTITQRAVPRYHNIPHWTGDFSGNAGVSASTVLYGVVPLHLFNITGLRHVFTPSVSYNYTPEHSLYHKIFTSVVPFTSQRDKPSQSVGLSLSNELQGKMASQPAAEGEKPVETKFQIVSANVNTGYDMVATSHKWSDLSLSASTSYNIMHISYGSSFFMYDESNKQIIPVLKNYNVSISTGTLGTSGTLWEGDKIAFDSLQPKYDHHYDNAGPQKWQASISPSYTFNQTRNRTTDQFTTSKQYSLSASAGLNFTRNWTTSWSSTYNFTTNQLVNNDFHFSFDQDCWSLRFDWRPGGAGAYNPGYYFMVNIKKIPEIKWENRG